MVFSYFTSTHRSVKPLKNMHKQKIYIYIDKMGMESKTIWEVSCYGSSVRNHPRNISQLKCIDKIRDDIKSTWDRCDPLYCIYS